MGLNHGLSPYINGINRDGVRKRSYSVSTPLPSAEGTLRPSPPRHRRSEPPRDTPSRHSGRWPPSAAAPSPPGNIRTDAGRRRSTARASGRLWGKRRGR